MLAGAIAQFKGKSARMALSDLKHLAGKNRDRIDRITARAAALDKRGDSLETVSNTVLDKHETVLTGLEAEMKQIDAFNSEMSAQLGNEIPSVGSQTPVKEK
jgi:hypothetical protein